MTNTALQSAVLTKSEFDKLSGIIYSSAGIRITPAKKIMLETRLRKRLRILNIENFSDYCNLLFSKEGERTELIHMIDVVTTNKTEFFREPKQFVYLTDVVLPAVLGKKSKLNKSVKIWSAGCSTGEEVYTLGMVLSQYSEKKEKINYSLLGTDISTQVLETAVKAVYPVERVNLIPYELKRKYLLKSKNNTKQLVRIKPEIRSKTAFRRLNFMDLDLGIRETIDIIFCRNVIIYFDSETQQKVVEKFCRLLPPGGYLFLGHSETVFTMNLPLVQVAPSIYKKN